MADSDNYDWVLFGITVPTYAPTHSIEEAHLLIVIEAVIIIIIFAAYQYIKCVRAQTAGVIPQALFWYAISTAIYGWFRVLIQYNKLALFFANWHVLCEVILLLNILQGERISSMAFDVMFLVLWLMSIIIAYVPLTEVLVFMQTFGFLTDNMLVWVQFYAYYETQLPLYLWGVVGGVIHVVMLTIGILDPLTPGGIGLALASMMLVPMMFCYTMQSCLYVQHWREHRCLPYMEVHNPDVLATKLHGVSLYTPALYDLNWTTRQPAKHEDAKTELTSVVGPPQQEDNKLKSGASSNFEEVQAPPILEKSSSINSNSPSIPNKTLLVQPECNVYYSDYAANPTAIVTMNLHKIRVHIKRRQSVWVLGFFIAVIWFAILFAGLGKF